MSKAEEIKKEIAGFKKQLAKPGTSDAMKKTLESIIKNAEAQLAKAEGAEKKEPATEGHVATEADRKKDPYLSADSTVYPKKKRDRSKKKTDAKEDDETKPHLVTVTAYGETKTFDISDCKQAILAMKARQQRDVESGAKTKSRLPVTAAATSITKMGDHIVDMIPDKKIASNPEKVIKALEKFESYFDKAVDSLKEIGISAANITKLKDALDAIEEEIKAIKKSAEKK